MNIFNSHRHISQIFYCLQITVHANIIIDVIQQHLKVVSNDLPHVDDLANHCTGLCHLALCKLIEE